MGLGTLKIQWGINLICQGSRRVRKWSVLHSTSVFAHICMAPRNDKLFIFGIASIQVIIARQTFRDGAPERSASENLPQCIEFNDRYTFAKSLSVLYDKLRVCIARGPEFVLLPVRILKRASTWIPRTGDLPPRLSLNYSATPSRLKGYLLAQHLRGFALIIHGLFCKQPVSFIIYWAR